MTNIYTPLPTTDYTVAESRNADADDDLAPPFKTIPSYPLAVLCFFAVSLTACVLFLLDAHLQMSDAGNVKHDTLRYPSVYVGFEKLTRNASSPSWPLSIAHPVDYVTAVDANSPSYSASPDQSIVLKSNNSVVFQYRVRDHGLENCVVSVKPSQNVSMTEETEVIAWLLAPSSMQRADFSGSTKPKREAFLGRFNISSPHVWSHSSSFLCRPRSQVLIELSLECASLGSCSVNLGSSRAFARHAVTVIQSEAPLLNQ